MLIHGPFLWPDGNGVYSGYKSDCFMERPIVNFVIKQFYESKSNVTKPVLDKWIKTEFPSGAYSAEILEELITLGVIIRTATDRGLTAYIMPQSVKERTTYIPKAFESDRYGYFIDVRSKETDAEKLHKFHQQENDKNIYLDYLRVKNERKIFMWCAIVELGLLLWQLLK